MSSYGHYAVSSSFPADYGILAAARNVRSDNTNEEDNVDALDDDSETPYYARPTNPFTAPVTRKTSVVSLSHERTPLLSPSIPRIHEEVHEHGVLDGVPSQSAVYFEELRILSKYTLPVFGQVFLLHLLSFSSRSIALTF